MVERQSRDVSEVVPEVPAVGIRNTRSLDAAGSDRFEDGELSVIRGAAEWMQDHPVDPSKHGCGGSDTERQSEHCDRCEGRGSTEDSRPVPEVFKDASHGIRGFERNSASDYRS